jgi:hypothetical protein
MPGTRAGGVSRRGGPRRGRARLAAVELFEDDALHHRHQRLVACRAVVATGVHSQLEVVVLDQFTLKRIDRDAVLLSEIDEDLVPIRE